MGDGAGAQEAVRPVARAASQRQREERPGRGKPPDVRLARPVRVACVRVSGAHVPLLHLLRQPQVHAGEAARLLGPARHGVAREHRLMDLLRLLADVRAGSGAGGARGLHRLWTLTFTLSLTRIRAHVARAPTIAFDTD